MSSIPNLAHLPTEILLQIFKTETLTTRDRCSVALSARRLNHLATPLIYCQLYLGKKEPQKRLAILANIIEHQSHLAALVEEVSLAIINGYWDGKKFRNEPAQTRNLIELNLVGIICQNALNLTSLSIGNLSGELFGMQYADTITTEAMKNLHTLRLWNLPTQKEHMFKIMSLPKLRNLTVSNFEEYYSDQPENLLHRRLKNTASQLENLVLGPYVAIGSSLIELLNFARNTSRLKFNIGPYDDGFTDDWRERRLVSTLSEILDPISNTLIILKLEGYHNDYLHKAKVDFSSFTNLRSLKITQSLLFPTLSATSMNDYSEPESRNGLFYRLPRSLQKLTLFFAPGTAIMDRKYRPHDRFFIEEDYDWIEEFGLHKESSFPELEKVKITEHSSCMWTTDEHNRSEMKLWDVPTDMRELFQKQNIGLFVLVRKSYEYRLEDDDEDGFFYMPSPKRLGHSLVKEEAAPE